MSGWCWLALVEERPPGALTAAPVGEGGWLAAWERGERPVAHALRADARIVDPAGAPATASLVLTPRGVRLAFDDLAVQQARRQILAGPSPALVTTLLTDSSHFEGSLTAWRGGGAHEDPFARIFPARRLEVGAGLLGAVLPPAGPTIERYGSANPWPSDSFS